jgi:tRNA nucleotidyltransferase (CCA-adding enzyme)
MGDLQKGVIRCVGNPTERFSEDALRMLRAVRFAAQLGFQIEEQTSQAIEALSPSIARVSAERIQTELVKLLVSKHPEELRTAYQLSLTKVFLPEFDAMMETDQKNKHHCYSVGEHTIAALCQVRQDKILRLAVLFHDVAKPCCRTTDENGQNHFKGHPAVGAELTKAILKRLKFDNDTIEKVCVLVANHDDRPPLTEKNVRHAICRVGVELFPLLFEVKLADTFAQSSYHRKEKLDYIAQYKSLFETVRNEGQCVSKADMNINGKDLLALGMKPGKELGAVLDALFELVLDDPKKNTKENLIEEAHKLIIPFIG